VIGANGAHDEIEADAEESFIDEGNRGKGCCPPRNLVAIPRAFRRCGYR
jgi:hypothetical protein